MWSSRFIKQALCAVRVHRPSSTLTVQNASRSFRQNNRYFASAPSDVDMLFNLGKESSTSKKGPRNPHQQMNRNILDAISFTPKSGKTTRKGATKDKASAIENDVDATQKKKEAKIARKKLISEAPTFDELTVHDETMDLSFVKLPLGHPQIQRLMLMTRSKKHRSQKHLLMIEGQRLIEDALNAALPLKYLFFSRNEKLDSIKDLLHSKCSTEMPKIFRVPQHDLTFWSVMTTCPGLIAIFEKSDDMTEIWDRAQEQSVEGNEPHITVICDQIREPNNIGSIIRTCAALPCAQVILMKGCTDPWDTKALRGGCGGQFRVPIRGPMEWESLPSFLADKDQYSVFVASNKLEQTVGDKKRRFRSQPYTVVPFVRCNHVVLIVGGETEGVSYEALSFMADSSVVDQPIEEELAAPKNSCIHIPLSNGVESLNANAAAAIMLFEIRKQLTGN